jgi:hypothetical protein
MPEYAAFFYTTGEKSGLGLGASMMKTFYASVYGALIFLVAAIPPAIAIIDSIGL